MDERLAARTSLRGSVRTVLHPSRHGPARVLIVAHDEATCHELRAGIPSEITVRSVRGAADTEGLGAEVVVVGGPFPLAEIVEVRAHPELHDKPIVLFAPSKVLPELDWHSMDVWPVITESDPYGELIGYISHLLTAAGHADLEEPQGSPDSPHVTGRIAG